jgi:hypothetical protein
MTRRELASLAVHQPLAIRLRNAKQPSDGSNGCNANRLLNAKLDVLQVYYCHLQQHARKQHE